MTSAEQEERGRVAVLIGRTVRIRFALDADSFADCLLELARAHSSGPDQPPHEHLRRLSLDDLYLATACSRGDEAAWAEFTARYLRFLRDFARRYLPEADAADLADQVVADLWQSGKLARYQGRSALRTWLGAVVAHAALNSGKAARRRVPLEGEQLRFGRRRPEATGEPAGAREARGLLGDLVGRALAALPADEKLLLLLHYEQGLTLDELAIALHSSKSALCRRLKRTREKLRAAVESLARQRLGVSAGALREGVDLRRVDLDLGRLQLDPEGIERQAISP